MTTVRPIRDLDVPLSHLESDMRALVERQRVDASVDKLRWLLAEQTHQLDPADRAFAALACNCPEACSCDDSYPGWAEHIAALQAANRTTRKEA